MKALAIAHRGKHDIYYENTLEAFKDAAKNDYYGIETDIHLTRDGKWITHHNETIISGGKEYTIKELSFDEIISMHLDNEQGHENATVCRFEDYLAVCIEGNKRPIIEIKHNAPKNKLKELGAYVDKEIGLDNVTFISFYPQPLLKLQSLYKKRVHLQMLVDEYVVLIKLALLRKMGLDIIHTKATKKMIDKFHKKHLEYNAWTVDQIEDVQKLDEWGIDYITSNTLNQKS